MSDGLRRVPGERDRRGVALVGVPGGRVHVDVELVAVLLAAGEGAEADRARDGGELSGVLDLVVAVAARRGRRAGERAAVDDLDVELARERVARVAVGR